MTFDEPPVTHILQAAPKDEDSPPDPPRTDQGSKGERFEIPSADRADVDRMERGYDRGIHGDERGGQVPKRPRR